MTIYPINPAQQISMQSKLIFNGHTIGTIALDQYQESIDGKEASAINRVLIPPRHAPAKKKKKQKKNKKKTPMVTGYLVRCGQFLDTNQNSENRKWGDATIINETSQEREEVLHKYNVILCS